MKDTFKNTSAAAEAGYDIAPGRQKEITVDGQTLQIRDTSGGNSFGYEFTAYKDGRPIAKTHTIWIETPKGDRFVNRFRSDEIRKHLQATSNPAPAAPGRWPKTPTIVV
jgi:hypothetical protein